MAQSDRRVAVATPMSSKTGSERGGRIEEFYQMQQSRRKHY
jgi:hypothetical protein